MPDNDLFAGRYRLRSNLGPGAMGEVRLADDTVLGRPVGIKQLRADPALGVDQEMVDVAAVECAGDQQGLAVGGVAGIKVEPRVIDKPGLLPGRQFTDEALRVTQRRDISSLDRDQHPVWHPSGNAVVWQSDRDAGDTEIYWKRPDGSQQTRLPFHPGFDGVPDVRDV